MWSNSFACQLVALISDWSFVWIKKTQSGQMTNWSYNLKIYPTSGRISWLEAESVLCLKRMGEGTWIQKIQKLWDHNNRLSQLSCMLQKVFFAHTRSICGCVHDACMVNIEKLTGKWLIMFHAKMNFFNFFFLKKKKKNLF